MNTISKYFSKKSELPFLVILLIAAAVIRIIFFNGMVFSDDSYYNQLALSLLSGEFAKDYIGYPIFLIRKLHTVLTSFSFWIFGINEIGSIVFPFLFSLASIILVYKFTLILFDDLSTARIAAFLYSFFPTDVIFSTINFSDLQCAFLINLGLYFLYLGYRKNADKYAILSGIFFSMSLLMKENLLFVLLLLVVLQVYLLVKHRILNRQANIALIVVFVFLALEGLFYYFFNYPFEYRLTILQKNYLYCYYDFFPYTLLGSDYTSFQYYEAIFKQVFLLNPKYLFLRRYYLGLPIIAFVQSVIFLKKGKEKLLVFWMLGMIILLLSMSTSMTEYKPFDLRRNWYIFIALMPIIIFSAKFLSKQLRQVKIAALVLYILASLYMLTEYQKFFRIDELNELKSFIRKNGEVEIFTDHSTKYGLDVVRGEGLVDKTKIIIGGNYDLDLINKDALVIFNKNVIDELKLQGHGFPDFKMLESTHFSKLNSFGEFIIYQKN